MIKLKKHTNEKFLLFIVKLYNSKNKVLLRYSNNQRINTLTLIKNKKLPTYEKRM